MKPPADGATVAFGGMIVLLGFATAALVDAAIGPWSGKEAGEMALLGARAAEARSHFEQCAKDDAECLYGDGT